MSDDATLIELRWPGGMHAAGTTLRIYVHCRPLTSDELHTLADVVSAIEEFRATVTGEVPELEP
jgi:hypothetical protein